MLTHKTIVLFKIEPTPGTDAVPTAGADAMLVENPQWAFANARMLERMPARVSQGKLKPLYAGSLVQFTFDVEIKGSGAAGTPPEFGPLLRAASLGETIVASTSVTYAPVSSAQEYGTLYFYKDGKLIKAVGCLVTALAGNVAVGDYGKISVTVLGHFVSEADAGLPTPTYLANTPPVGINVPFVIDGRTPALTAFNFDLGLEVGIPDDITKADSFGLLRNTGRKVGGSFDDEDALVATYDWVTKWQQGAVLSLTTGVVGATAGNRYAITCPAATYTEQAPGDKVGIRTRDHTFHAAETASADDEISIAFT